ncbi:hypothetical protein N7527_004846, partial [Penicillium freii]
CIDAVNRCHLSQYNAGDVTLPPAHLRALSRVSSRLYLVLVPHIYRTIAFHAASEWALNVLDVDSFFLYLGQSRSVGYLQHAPFHLVRFNRCAYYNIFRAAGLPESPITLGASDEATAHQQFLDDVKDQLQMIFTYLKPNSLSTFESIAAWNICPDGSSRSGRLSQPILTAPRPSLTRHRRYLSSDIAPSGRAIRTIESDGLRSYLDHLSIGFVYSASARALCWERLGLQEPELGVGDIGVEKPTAVPTLSSLALSRVTLPLNLLSENSSIFCSLRALTLRDYLNQLRLLQLLSRSQKPLQLEHFETSLDLLLHEPGDRRSLSAVVRFLRSFRGLQHLHLRLSNFPASESRI